MVLMVWRKGAIRYLGWNAIFFFCLFRVAPAAYGGSQARGLIRAVAASLHHSHSHARSEPTPQLMAMLILNPLIKARDRTCILMDASQLCDLELITHLLWSSVSLEADESGC